MIEKIRALLPSGMTLPDDAWRGRHNAIVVVLAVHAVGLAGFAIYRGFTPWHALGEGLLLGAFAALAAWPFLGRRARSIIASAGLVSSSALLVHVSGGYIEAHFHFFVVLAVIALYEDWVAFLLAIAYVALHHGLVGALFPLAVYNHPDGAANPWTWAVIHAVFVLAESAALIAGWRVAENARLRSERTASELAATLESTVDGILVVGRDGRIASFNKHFVEMWRIPPDIVASRDDARAVAHVVDQLKDPDAFVAKVKEVYASEAESFDVLDFADGRTFERYSQPLRLNGAIAGRVWSFRDVTERRRAEEERRVNATRAMEIERLTAISHFKTQLLNTASHELNTPITPIKLQLHILKTNGDLNLRAKHAFGILDRNVERLAGLVQDILDVARLQNGRLPLVKEPADIRTLAAESVESFAGAAQAAGVELSLDDGEHVVAEADAKRVTQILFNLLSNALKFTPRGGEVRVAVQVEGEEAHVRISDTGAGLDASQIARLFQPFTQVHDTMQKTRAGTGLGLYISRGIAEQHGGRVWCESRGPGRGATFTVALPIRAAEPVLLAASDPPPRVPASM